jgi:hypothetical protein
MTCKYQHNPFPPCRFEQHPYNNNIYYCPHCRESYDVRDVAYRPPIRLLLMIAAIVFILLNMNSESSRQPQKPPTSHTSHHTHTK